MKQIFLILILLASWVTLYSQSPFLIEEEFNAAPTPPAGWTFTGSISTYTTVGFYGKSSPSLKFQAGGDQVTTPTWVNGDLISFMLRCPTATGASDFMQVEVYDGSTWTTVANIQPHTTSTVATISISTSVTQARLTYSTIGTNVALDDFTVRKAGSCQGSLFKLTFINVDACGTSCEGRDEFFTFNTGSDSMDFSNIEFNVPDAGSFSNSWCGSGSGPCDNYLLTNPTEVDALNTLAGCTIFLSPIGKIPPNSKVLVFGGNPQSTQTNFNNICSSGVQYYAVFANNTSDCTGHFGNYSTGTSDPYRSFFIRDRTTGCTDTNYYYVNNSGLNNGDGSSVSYLTGSTPNYVNTNCLFVTLPVTFLFFNAMLSHGDAVLWWSTASEINSDYFTVQRSFNATDFEDIANVDAAGNSSSQRNYEYVDRASSLSYMQRNIDPLSGNILYYRLKQTDYDGKVAYSRVAAVDINKQQNEWLKIFPNPSDDWVFLCFNPESDISAEFTGSKLTLDIFHIEGKQVIPSQVVEFSENKPVTVDIRMLPKGVYIFRAHDQSATYRSSFVKQ